MKTALRMGILLVPFVMVLALGLLARLGQEARIAGLAESVRLGIVSLFSLGFIAMVAFAVIALVVVTVFLSSVRIGGPAAPRVMAPSTAIAVGFAASTSIGLLFWSAAEPLIHFSRPPPGFGAAARSGEASTLARGLAVFHWGFVAHALCGIFLVVFGLAVETQRRATSLGGLFFQSRTGHLSAAARFLDLLAVTFPVLLLVGGLASTALMIAISFFPAGFGIGGRIFGPAASHGFAVILIVILVFVAGARPPSTTFAWLARGCLVLLLVLIAAVILLGPTRTILFGGLQALWDMLKAIPHLMFAPFSGTSGWATGWTATHVAGFAIFAPLTGAFLARAARGYRIDDAVIYFVLVPLMLTALCILVFGGLAVAVDARGGVLTAAMQREGIDVVLFEALGGLRGVAVLRVLMLGLFALAFASFAAAILHALMRMIAPGADSATGVIASRRVTVVLWAFLFGASGWAAERFGAVDLIEAVGRLGALPALLFVFLGALAALRYAFLPLGALVPPPDAGVDVTRYDKEKSWKIPDDDPEAYREAVRNGKPKDHDT